MTAMLIDTILNPPLVLEGERTTLGVVGESAGECCLIGIWFEELLSRSITKYLICHGSTSHTMFDAPFVPLLCP